MTIYLDPTERRVVGTLIEKQLSVPESYPLTLNSLVLGCNQKSNRDPESHYAEHEVHGALQSLMNRGWASELELAGSRTRRYAHRAEEQLGVEATDLAILAELLLRGPQSAPELKTRASRMRPLASLEDVERRLEALGARTVPYVRLLGRRTGERVPRWEHLLAPPAEAGAAVSPAPTSAPSFERPPAFERSPAPSSLERPAAAAHPLGEASLIERVERLEREVESLRRRLEHGGA